MRPALRLLPLPLCIAFSLNAHAADDMPPNWGLCPVQDVVKPFAEAQAAPRQPTPTMNASLMGA